MKTIHLAGIALGAGALWLTYQSMQARKKPPKIYYKPKLWGNYNGFIIPAFGIWIKESERSNEALLQHELVHWRQYQERGLLPFLVEYGYYALTKGYDKNPLEIEARANETPYCQIHYTECVRTGISRTAHNPHFRH